MDALLGITACFLGRIPGVDVDVGRDDAIARLAPHHERLLRDKSSGAYPLVTAEQVHGAVVTIVEHPPINPSPLPGVDGLLSATRGITLGIYVADCAPVWVVARDGRAGALLHSGKMGTELGIVPNGIHDLCALAGTKPADLMVVIGPCIRPPCYEVDFAAAIRDQAARAGVPEIHDRGVCTACHPDHYYSYRRDRGLTGRMLATLTLLP